ncbi:MAG: purine-nucleoside phosphorylase [Bacteroidales bacterium]|nr:purine-nucleoside phosphorylase [Bacteroidales bacterium]
MDERVIRINNAAGYVESILDGRKPLVGLVLGSGLGQLAELVEDKVVIPYKDIPFFPVSTAIGHKGNYIAGRLAGKVVIAMQGRFHYYEGYPMEMVTIGIRVMKALGVKYLFVSNAAGSCNPEIGLGDICVIRDHINNLPNPLIGPNLDEFGPRFPDMTCAYDLELQKLAFNKAKELGISLKRGVYFGSTGPTYETPAEVRFYRSIGADLLGMSTIPEVIVARHCGLRVFGVSVATNCANTTNDSVVLNDPQDVIEQADRAAENLARLLNEMIKSL